MIVFFLLMSVSFMMHAGHAYKELYKDFGADLYAEILHREKTRNPQPTSLYLYRLETPVSPEQALRQSEEMRQRREKILREQSAKSSTVQNPAWLRFARHLG